MMMMSVWCPEQEYVIVMSSIVACGWGMPLSGVGCNKADFGDNASTADIADFDSLIIILKIKLMFTDTQHSHRCFQFSVDKAYS